ncbi:hypothetical protein TKK_0005439 [Trichogramma kaykai]|uniref:Peptidase S1 domain-containing protein n=1 Tax=Trichogramma kaykai TaxID=54128 RepID=A0ABD2XHS3_9HYME
MHGTSCFLVSALLLLRINHVFGQIASNNFIAPLAIQNNVITPYIVNDGVTICKCAYPGSCPTTVIDVRIVNDPTNSGCPAGMIMCCTRDGNNPSPNPAPDTCGIRKIPAVPQQVAGRASFGAYPWQAILKDRSNNYLGSGVLLDATHVLTVAHKVVAYLNNPQGMLVGLGEWDDQSTSEAYRDINVNVARIVLHPNFNSANLENDVAVIKLNGLVPIASYPNINTACRPAAAPVTGTRCFVSGWGKNSFTGSYQNIMREVDVPILDGTDCENRLKNTRLGAAFILNRNSFLCAGGEPGKDACTGDGGSPLVCLNSQTSRWSVYGLVAWGIGCATTNVPGVYTNVYNFLPWINQILATV